MKNGTSRMKMLGCCALTLAVVLCGLFPTRATAQDAAAAEALETLLAESWEYDLEQDPLFASRVGDHRFDNQLPQVSEELALARRNRLQQFLDRAVALEGADLERQQEINRDIFIGLLRNRIAEVDFEMYLIPLTNRWGFHIDFVDLPRQTRFSTIVDYEAYIARLRGFRRYAEQHIVLLRDAAERGYTLPAVVLEGYHETIDPHIVEDPMDSLLYEPLRSIPQRIAASERERLQQQARDAIRDSVVPGYAAFLEFMRDEYLPAARGSIAAAALPNGREFYRHRVRQYTTLDMSPEEVHELGLREVARIDEEMRAVPRRVNFEGTYEEFVDHLRTSPEFYAETAEELLKEVALTLKRMDGELPGLFKRLPRMPYGIREVPSYIAPRTTTAYYSQPSGDGRRAGFYFVNTYNLSSRPLYEVEALSLHEAVPGHHLQLALQQELEDLPPFRRFAGFTAFVEGWALYSERLGLEVGFYEDAYSDFGRLSYEQWRACRLVVDTGMHYLGWSRQQAIDFMAEHTALSLHNIEAEIDRYISWPGQALAYKVGELKIRELRALAEEKMGDAFDLREFHDVVLRDGSVPLPVLEQNVTRYIESATE